MDDQVLENKVGPDASPSDEAVNDGSLGKAYQSPEVRVYGDIKEVTQGFGARNTMDGQGGGAMGFKSIP